MIVKRNLYINNSLIHLIISYIPNFKLKILFITETTAKLQRTEECH